MKFFLLRVRRLGFIAATIYVGILLVISLLETSLIYPVPPASAGDWQADWLPHEDVHFQSADGTALHGWYTEHPAARCSILICHGNGEDVTNLAEELAFFRDHYRANVFAFDYRGYGLSAGRPFEAGILADGMAAQQWLRSAAAWNSIGSFFMVVRWEERSQSTWRLTQGSAALVLDRTFSSMVEVASSHFPWLPIRWMLRNRYPSSQRIATYDGPLLQFHGLPDEVVSFRFAKQLFDACPSKQKEFVTSETLTHNAPWPPAFYEHLQSFLDKHL